MKKETFENLKKVLYFFISMNRSEGVSVDSPKVDELVEVAKKQMGDSLTAEEVHIVRSYIESNLYVKHDHDKYPVSRNQR